MNIKTLAIAILFLGMTGCGCGDDGPGTPPGPQSEPPAFRNRTTYPPAPLTPPDTNPECLIDVFFLLDDSAFMNAANGMGLIPFNLNDNRSKQVVAQRVFEDLRARIKAEVENRAAPLIQNGTLPANTTFDFAFGVGRYEDYGGNLTRFSNANGIVDAFASPFMLNMPLLREDHDSFPTSFDSAIARQSVLGSGNVQITQLQQETQDPQSAVEALKQIADGVGYDGNGDGDTLDYGLPCSDTAQAPDHDRSAGACAEREP